MTNSNDLNLIDEMNETRMKKNAQIILETISLKGIALILLLSIPGACVQEKDSGGPSDLTMVFPRGQLGPSTNFTGNAYNFGLLENDSVYNTLAGNVYFEKGARSNWHTHPSGQILIIIDGEGYHQIEGKPKQKMIKGDVVKCPPNAKHWHGATENSSLSQMYIVPNTQNGIVNWMEPVTDEQYSSK